MNDLTTFDQNTRLALMTALEAKHNQLAQRHLDKGKRSLTARNYASSIWRLRDYMENARADLPTRGVLESWRDTMQADGLAVSTINARLSAVRKLLRGVAADTTNLRVKLVFESWANVENARAITVQDKTEVDYGLRLTLDELQAQVTALATRTVKGLRDRALLAVMAGAGLRVSEAVNLTMRDVFMTENGPVRSGRETVASGRGSSQRGIKVTHGKHHKSRVIVLNHWNSWVLQAVEAYTIRLGLSPMMDADALIFRTCDRWGHDAGQPLSGRGAQRAIEALSIVRGGQTIALNAHDLRRTYARLCKASGMSWEALQANMGHSSVEVTQRYVGQDVDWSERVPNWTVTL